jgi:SAM-dependent methyltransferase
MSDNNADAIQWEAFCQEHGIEISEVVAAVGRVREALLTAQIIFDTEKYGLYGVLRVEFRTPGVSMLPMLFGTPPNLSHLARFLWEASSETWSDEMEDITQRGTYLKRRVLIPAVLGAVEAHYRPGAHILDAGCGEGVLFRELVRRYDNVYGFDFVPAFVERLTEEYPQLRDRLWAADIIHDDFSKTYDIVVASALLLVLPDIDRGIERLFDLVAPGGVLIIADVLSREHRSQGYYDGSRLIRVHDREKVSHFEKDVGGGQTTAIHNYHPPGYYRQKLEGLGAVCLEDRDLVARREEILADPEIPDEARELVLQRMASDLVNPTFFLLVVSKKEGH